MLVASGCHSFLLLLFHAATPAACCLLPVQLVIQHQAAYRYLLAVASYMQMLLQQQTTTTTPIAYWRQSHVHMYISKAGRQTITFVSCIIIRNIYTTKTTTFGCRNNQITTSNEFAK